MSIKNSALLGLDENGKLIDKGFSYGPNGIAYIIKDMLGNIIWAPYSQGDCGSSTPFPKGYVPQTGQCIALPKCNNTKYCTHAEYDTLYVIHESVLLTAQYGALNILIVKER
jgi:hypothetical protein